MTNYPSKKITKNNLHTATFSHCQVSCAVELAMRSSTFRCDFKQFHAVFFFVTPHTVVGGGGAPPLKSHSKKSWLFSQKQQQFNGSNWSYYSKTEILPWSHDPLSDWGQQWWSFSRLMGSFYSHCNRAFISSKGERKYSKFSLFFSPMNHTFR